MRAFSWLSYLLIACACGASDAPVEPSFPCDVQAALTEQCLGCHANPPMPGVPFTLSTWASTREETTLTRSGAPAPVWQAMQEVLEDGSMPLDPERGVAAPLDEAHPDRVLLLSWLAAGAPAAGDGESCVHDGGP